MSGDIQIRPRLEVNLLDGVFGHIDDAGDLGFQIGFRGQRPQSNHLQKLPS